MRFWGKAIGLGILVWLVAFVAAFLILPIHESSRSLFESIAAVVFTGVRWDLGSFIMRHVIRGYTVEAIRLGIL